MTDDATAYIDAIKATHRPLFDRVSRLIHETFPDVTVGIAYKMPAFTVGKCSLYVGVWSHGLSIYGWADGRDGGFTERHPQMTSGKGTIRIPLAAADEISDDEIRDLVREALAA